MMELKYRAEAADLAKSQVGYFDKASELFCMLSRLHTSSSFCSFLQQFHMRSGLQ